MKKPNITEGVWHEWFGMVKTPCGEYNIARCDTDTEFKRSEIEANAKAISAVPDMINALIEMRKLWYIECWEFAYGETEGDSDEATRHADNQYYIKMIDKALTKAGVTEL